MSGPHDQTDLDYAPPQPDRPVANGKPQGSDPESKGGHGHWMMIACCIPMLVIAVIIALSGAGFGFLFAAVACTAMMALMMVGMSSR